MKKKTSSDRAAGTSDAAVERATGKTWKRWFAILDKWGARKKTHREIAAYLYEKQGVPGWWAQMVTVGYERVRGMRQVHQTPEGYAASRSKTYNVPLTQLYAAWKNEKARRRWMKGDRLEASTVSPNRAIRGKWDGGASRVDVMFLAKGAGKSQVAIDHRRLSNQRNVVRMKSYWGEQLDRLASLLKA